MKLFVDTNRNPKNVYSDPNNWEIARNRKEFLEKINTGISTLSLPEAVSFDYDLENEKDGLLCLNNLVKMCVKLRIKLPKIYLHCSDRSLSIQFENALDEYTKKTDIPYYFEYIKK